MKTSQRKVVAAVLALGIASANVPTVIAHEVPIHKAITDLAIDYLIQQRPELAACGEPEIRQQLKYGVDHEDDYWLDFVPVGDFFFHFQNATLQPLHDVVKPGEIPSLEVGASCSASDWLFGANSCERTAFLTVPLASGGGQEVKVPLRDRSNEFAYSTTLGELFSPYASSGKAKGVVGLGHVIHLLQDMTSPAHTRNDAHPHVPDGLSFLSKLRDSSMYEVHNLKRLITWKHGDGVGPDIIPMPTAPLLDPFPDSFMSALQAHTRSQAYSEKNLTQEIESRNGPVPANIVNGYALDATGGTIARVNPNSAGRRTYMIDETVAAAQFTRLAPEAIRWTASLLNSVQQTHPICETQLRVDYGAGKVTSSADPARPGEAIACGVGMQGPLVCKHRFPSGSMVTLTAQRVVIPSNLPGLPPLWDSGEFVEWRGACAGQGPVCQLRMGDMMGSDPRTRMDVGTEAEFQKDSSGTVDYNFPDTNVAPSFLPPSLDPIVNGNQVQLSGNWRVRFGSGDDDGFQMAVAIEDPFHRGQVLRSGHAFRFTDNFSHELYFGAEGEHDYPKTVGLPRSKDVVGVLRFWIDEDDDGFPPPTLLQVRPAIATTPAGGGLVVPNRFEILLGQHDDRSRIDLVFELERLPD